MSTAPIAILRVTKLKSGGNVGGSLAHTYRTRPTPNADPARAWANEHSHDGPAGVAQALRARLPEKRRKDAVIGLEYVIGASPSWFRRKGADDSAYFAQALDWLREKHGADNVVGWSIHRDEKTPHLVAYVVPLDAAGKLNAKAFTGGRALLSSMQTDFVRRVAQHHGLVRGIEGSKARHQTVKEWYAQVAKDGPVPVITAEDLRPQVTKKGLVRDVRETPEEVAARLSEAMQALWTPTAKRAQVATTERQKAAEMARTARDTAAALKEAQEAARKAQEAAEAARKGQSEAEATAALYRSIFEAGLTASQKQRLVSQAKRMQAENQAQAEAERRSRMTPEQIEWEAREQAAFQRSLRVTEDEELTGQSDKNHDSPAP